MSAVLATSGASEGVIAAPEAEFVEAGFAVAGFAVAVFALAELNAAAGNNHPGRIIETMQTEARTRNLSGRLIEGIKRGTT